MTTQPNTEPLKVGEECREAFERVARQKFFSVERDGDTYKDFPTQLLWGGYRAGYEEAWNRRTEPSPAEVSSEGLLKLLIEAHGQLEKEYLANTRHSQSVKSANATCAETPSSLGGLIESGYMHSRGNATKAMLDRLYVAIRDFRAAVKMTDDEILTIAREYRPVIFDDTFDEVGFARAIERALNQRLAVKEGEIDAVELAAALEQQRAIKIVSDVRETGKLLADGTYQAGYDMACEEIAFRMRTEQWVLNGVPTPLPAHPVSDDQQAKDAARYRWLRKRVGVMRDGAVFFPGGYSKITKEDEAVTDRAIDAALSTTKQEEA